MVSHERSYSDVLSRSQSPDMLKQRAVEEPHVEAEKKTVGEVVNSSPKIDVEVQVKKEKTEDEQHDGCDVSRPSFFYEAQPSLKGNSPHLSEDTNSTDIKEEERNNQSPSSDTKYSRESRGKEKDYQEMKESAERRKPGVSRDAPETSSPNEKKESKQSHKKRKLYELYAEELSLRNDLRKIHPMTSHIEGPLWHQVKEGEREMPENAENIAYAQYLNKMYADPSMFKRMGIHEIPSEGQFGEGIGRKPGPRTNDQICRNPAYLPPIDPRNRKFFIAEEPRCFPDEQTYRSLPDERLPRAWHPQYRVLYPNPANLEDYSKSDSKISKQSKEDVVSQPKEVFECRYRLQRDPYWPYFDRSAGRDDVNEKQRIAFLRMEHPGEERDNQTNPYAFATDRRPESRPSKEEYVKYVPVPNMLTPTPKPEFLLNGHRNMPFDIGHPFPVTDKSKLAFIEKDKVFYPCCNDEIPAIHYDNMASKARWLDNRNERQRYDPFHPLKPGVPFTGGNQPLFLDDTGTRIIHMNNLGYDQKINREKGDRFREMTLPAYVSGMQHDFLRKQFPSEETVTADRNARRIDGDRRKGEMFSSKEGKANGETPTAWQEKFSGSRPSKETLESKTWNTSKDVRTEMLKNEETAESGNKLRDATQVGEGTNALQGQKNSETQPKISLQQGGQDQDDPAKKTISCNVCKKTFNRTSNLYTHMRTHSANKPHACEFCGKRFHQKADLRIHRYIHTGEKPHKCTKCGRGFKQLTHLKYHMRTHSDVRMYKCPYCEKGFNQKSNLQAHIFGHTGQRPHKCDTCGKGFTLASTLNTHKRTHLPNKPFKCEFCDRAFYQKNALKMHYVSTHPYSSGVCLV